MHRFTTLITTAALLAATGCNILGPRQDVAATGSPEALLDVSSEVVNLGVNSPKEVDDVSQWINRDQPTRAELYCQEGTKNCAEARQVLDLYGVPNTVVSSPANTITLVYERVLARDCDHVYHDDLGLWYNESQPAFGCSVAANMVQQVTQKQQFVSPNLSDYRDAESATNGYVRYQRVATQATTTNAGQYTLGNSVLSTARTQ